MFCSQWRAFVVVPKLLPAETKLVAFPGPGQDATPTLASETAQSKV